MQDKEPLTEIRDDSVFAFEMVSGDCLPVRYHVDVDPHLQPQGLQEYVYSLLSFWPLLAKLLTD